MPHRMDVEEGEAIEEYGDADHPDPIAQRLEELLGDAQKEFEGGVSTDKLGSKFGGYGSFLPAKPRAPFMLAHPQASTAAPNALNSKNKISPVHLGEQNRRSQATASVTEASSGGTNVGGKFPAGARHSVTDHTVKSQNSFLGFNGKTEEIKASVPCPQVKEADLNLNTESNMAYRVTASEGGPVSVRKYHENVPRRVVKSGSTGAVGDTYSKFQNFLAGRNFNHVELKTTAMTTFEIKEDKKDNEVDTRRKNKPIYNALGLNDSPSLSIEGEEEEQENETYSSDGYSSSNLSPLSMIKVVMSHIQPKRKPNSHLLLSPMSKLLGPPNLQKKALQDTVKGSSTTSTSCGVKVGPQDILEKSETLSEGKICGERKEGDSLHASPKIKLVDRKPTLDGEVLKACTETKKSKKPVQDANGHSNPHGTTKENKVRKNVGHEVVTQTVEMMHDSGGNRNTVEVPALGLDPSKQDHMRESDGHQKPFKSSQKEKLERVQKDRATWEAAEVTHGREAPETSIAPAKVTSKDCLLVIEKGIQGVLQHKEVHEKSRGAVPLRKEVLKPVAHIPGNRKPDTVDGEEYGDNSSIKASAKITRDESLSVIEKGAQGGVHHKRVHEKSRGAVPFKNEVLKPSGWDPGDKKKDTLNGEEYEANSSIKYSAKVTEDDYLSVINGGKGVVHHKEVHEKSRGAVPYRKEVLKLIASDLSDRKPDTGIGEEYGENSTIKPSKKAKEVQSNFRQKDYSPMPVVGSILKGGMQDAKEIPVGKATFPKSSTEKVVKDGYQVRDLLPPNDKERNGKKAPSKKESKHSALMQDKSMKGINNVTSRELEHEYVATSSEYDDAGMRNYTKYPKGDQLSRKVLNTTWEAVKDRKSPRESGMKIREASIEKNNLDGSFPNLERSNLAATTTELLPVPAPLGTLILENWAMCEKCSRWRLLLPEIDPDKLPKKFFCKMLTWLPGMNSCKFEEDETTNAVYAYLGIPNPKFAQVNALAAEPVPSSLPLATSIPGLSAPLNSSLATETQREKHTASSKAVASKKGLGGKLPNGISKSSFLSKKGEPALTNSKRLNEMEHDFQDHDHSYEDFRDHGVYDSSLPLLKTKRKQLKTSSAEEFEDVPPMKKVKTEETSKCYSLGTNPRQPETVRHDHISKADGYLNGKVSFLGKNSSKISDHRREFKDTGSSATVLNEKKRKKVLPDRWVEHKKSHRSMTFEEELKYNAFFNSGGTNFKNHTSKTVCMDGKVDKKLKLRLKRDGQSIKRERSD